MDEKKSYKKPKLDNDLPWWNEKRLGFDLRNRKSYHEAKGIPPVAKTEEEILNMSLEDLIFQLEGRAEFYNYMSRDIENSPNWNEFLRREKIKLLSNKIKLLLHEVKENSINVEYIINLIAEIRELEKSLGDGPLKAYAYEQDLDEMMWGKIIHEVVKASRKSPNKPS